MGNLDIPKKVGIWSVQALIGKGAFSSVFLVRTELKGNKKFGYAAMKVEQCRRHQEEEALRYEISVLARMQGTPSFCTVYRMGRTKRFIYFVMTLLGKSIDELRRDQPSRRFSAATTLRIGIQLMKAFRALHRVGFIHRDVKPNNIAVGHKLTNVIYLFDFGWARFIYRNMSATVLRQQRRRVEFRGTYRYCSLNAQKCMDQGRVDDLWSVLFILAECRRGKLPWTRNTPRECWRKKECLQLAENLFEGCPPSLIRITKQLNLLGFYDRPDYETFIEWLEEDLLTDPSDDKSVFEWQREGYSVERIKTTDMTESDTTISETSQKGGVFTTIHLSDSDESSGEFEIEKKPSNKKSQMQTQSK
ncbi:hypothetical protein ACQ4LE_006198 [Meloidogyne hapla]